MKNIFKIIFILSLTIFAVTGCADNSGGNGGGNIENNGGGNTGDGGNTGEVYSQEFTRLISIGGLSYGETADGKRYVWGTVGELAGAGNTDNISTPKEVDFTIINNITNDSSYGSTYYILTDTGLYAWGDNYGGQVGNGKTESVRTPHKVAGIDGNIKEVINGSTVYILTDTGLYAWGYNRFGQVGNGTTEDVLTPHKAVDGNIKEFKIISSTYYAITEDGLYIWGNNSYGQVGNGTSGNKVLTPHKVVNGNIKEFKIISSIYYAITEDGLYIWGYNTYGRVGNGTIGNTVTTPHKAVEGNIKEVIVKSSNVYVLTDTGLYAWGNNESGQLGNGNSGYSPDDLIPHKVEGINGNIKEVIVNNDLNNKAIVYVLTDTGLYAWGKNDNGQVGNGKTDNVFTPHKAVEGNIKEVIANNNTVYVLTDNGLYAWGRNGSGQVGNGETENVLTPYKAVNGDIKEFKISGSGSNATYYAITEDGLYAWGNNSYGRVGNGTTDRVTTPHKVEGIDGNIKEVINGSTVYVLTDTGLYAWGRNDSGQVGNGKTNYVLTPHKAVDGNIKELKIYTINSKDTYYVLTDTGLYAWGYNKFGQVGNGTTEDVLTPYKVQIEKQN